VTGPGTEPPDAPAAGPADTPSEAPDVPASRPQLLLLMLFGDHVLDRGVCVSTGSVVEALARAGVSEHATRSTLTRMVNRGLLRRQRDGRRTYLGLTPRSADLLHDGYRRIWTTGAVNDGWDGTWTLLGFSLPESWQRERHGLRSQLAWAGFGPLQGGLWIAPGRVDVAAIVADLGLGAHVRVFRARADELTDVAQLVRDAWDLAGVAARYRAFLRRWDAGPAPVGDPLGARLTLVAEWLQAIRRDPRLPVRHLPADWPASRAQAVFRERAAATEPPARLAADTLLDTRPDEPAAAS
jgi:phenylacetic acid degradation operon negative regulatory protein